MIPPYLCGSFLKNHKRGGLKIFLQKKEENNPYMGVVFRRGQHCFLLVMYGFYSKNPLYSASLSFTMFSFFYSFWYRKLIRIKPHCGVAYRSMQQSCSPRSMNITFPREFVFVFCLVYTFYLWNKTFCILSSCYNKKCFLWPGQKVWQQRSLPRW